MTAVLIAEANRSLRELYRVRLGNQGFEVNTASDGLECLDKLSQRVPDWLILDLDLLWGGGVGVLGVVREEDRFRSVKVVLTSSSPGPQVIADLTSPPVVQTLNKPFPFPALLDLLAQQPLCGVMDCLEILVVDDESAIRDLLSRYLQGQGYRVWTAASGEEALQLCGKQGECLAVVLLDVHMPNLDGPQTLKGIRSLDPRLPVCFMTGNSGRYETSDLLRLGARQVISKPFRLDEVARIVHELANESQRNRQEMEQTVGVEQPIDCSS